MAKSLMRSHWVGNAVALGWQWVANAKERKGKERKGKEES